MQGQHLKGHAWNCLSGIGISSKVVYKDGQTWRDITFKLRDMTDASELLLYEAI